jgi:hypothetical protein
MSSGAEAAGHPRGRPPPAHTIGPPQTDEFGRVAPSQWEHHEEGFVIVEEQ